MQKFTNQYFSKRNSPFGLRLHLGLLQSVPEFLLEIRVTRFRKNGYALLGCAPGVNERLHIFLGGMWLLDARL